MIRVADGNRCRVWWCGVSHPGGGCLSYLSWLSCILQCPCRCLCLVDCTRVGCGTWVALEPSRKCERGCDIDCTCDSGGDGDGDDGDDDDDDDAA